MTEENEHETLAAEFDRIQGMDDSELEIPPPDRDEKGRFKAREPKEEEAGAGGTAPAAPEETQAVEQAPAAETPDQGSEPQAAPVEEPPLSPPDRWSAEWKTRFATLPREAQKVLLDRESEYAMGFDQKSQEAAEYKRRYEPIESILAPRRQTWAMQGMNEGQALSQLLALSDYAATKPQEFIAWFAQQRGIRLDDMAKPQSPALPPEVAPLADKLNTLEQLILRQQQTEQQRQQQQAEAAVQVFRQDKPHFDECSNEISVLIPAIRQSKPHATHQEVLQEAYDRATWATPSVRQKLLDSQKTELQAQQKAAEARKLEQANLAAKAARKAAGTVVSTRSVGAPKGPELSMRETMSRAWDELHGVA